MEWPDKFTKQITYICLAPVLIPMWVTIPDVRRQTSRKWYPVTFVNSILWIAFFSYLMVWWANTIGETLVIPTEEGKIIRVFEKCHSNAQREFV
ncbi:unnamed protein product [Heligmosomoides polygyrus]|uniref:Na_Ca_ex domain-containing protein n=1 Tax=Heligmosomoides polygyrus TaxID=6339 RepID=A0A183G2R7_HELPZ|nr:unnamed protein product [Heligmosomoides polygyrus]